MYYISIFWLISFFIVIISTSSFAEEKPLSHLANTELGLSVMVNNCVNVITGDFVESCTDLSVVGPEPLNFIRFYSSGDYKTRCLFQGWRHNLNNYIKNNFYRSFDGTKESLKVDVVESSGRSACFNCKVPYDEHKVTAKFDLDFTGKGFTNCGSGIISARTNP